MFFKKENKGLKAIYAMHSIQGFAMSLIGIFIPIYLLTLNYSVSQVLVFYIMLYAFLLFFAFFAIIVANKIGLQQTINLRFPYLFIYLISLFLLKSISLPLSIIALFGGLQMALYWIPLHILFTREAKHKEVGSSTSKLFAFPQLASMAGPILGGFIAAMLGFKILFIFVFLILFISVIPLFGSKQIKTSFKFKPSQGIKLFKKYPKYFFAEIFDNIGEEAESIIWPIFIYLSLVKIESVGIVGTLLALGSATFTLFIGKISDRYKKKQIIKVGAILLLFIWTTRYFIDSEIAFYVITVLAGFFTVLLLVPFTSLIYSIAKKDTMDEFFVFREIPVAIGRITILSLALLVVNKINITFLAAGVAYLYFLFL